MWCREQADTNPYERSNRLRAPIASTRFDMYQMRLKENEIQHCRGPLRHPQGVQIATGDNMSTSEPERSREPRVAMTKLKARATRMSRGVLHGNCRLWVDTNLNLQSSRNMLRRKRLSRTPHTTKARNRFPNGEESTTHQRQYTKRLHGDTNRVGRSCKSDHDQKQAGYSCCP